MTRECIDCPLKDAVKVQGSGLAESPRLMFIAEAPGETEQRNWLDQKQGVRAKKGHEPGTLVGKSGQLLRMILKDLEVDDEQCYFTNVCLCKPAGNKTPTAELINICYDGLMDEIELVRPGLIVTLGNVAAKAVGQYDRGVSTIRGMYRELSLSDGTRIGILPT